MSAKRDTLGLRSGISIDPFFRRVAGGSQGAQKHTRTIRTEGHVAEKSARGVGIAEGEGGGMGGVERVHPRTSIGCNADPVPIWDSRLSNAPGLALSFTQNGNGRHG